MGKVIEFPDLNNRLEYVLDRYDKFIGVTDPVVGIEITNGIDNTAYIAVNAEVVWTTKDNIKELMIAWLALNYPNVINFDED